jgi:chorismate mutase
MAMWQAELQLLREAIDQADEELVGVLERRFQLTRRVGALKRQHAQPPLDPARGPAQITAFVSRAEAAGIDSATAEALFRVIYDRVGLEHRQAQAADVAG